MIKIRQEQIEVFDKVAVKNFEDRMVGYLRDYFPKHCGTLAEGQIREVIKYGIEQAKSYNFIFERSINLYLNLMFLLGSRFDMDLQLPWAAELLNDKSVSHEPTRIDRLYERAMAYLDEVAGKENEHINAALQLARQEQPTQTPPKDSPDFYKFIISRLKSSYPQKCAAVGELNLRRLIQRGIDAAGVYGIADGGGIALYISLMFLLGSGFDTDPLFPWAAKILHDEEYTNHKTERLYEASMTYLDGWLL